MGPVKGSPKKKKDSEDTHTLSHENKQQGEEPPSKKSGRGKSGGRGRGRGKTVTRKTVSVPIPDLEEVTESESGSKVQEQEDENEECKSVAVMLSKNDLYIIDYVRNQAPYIFDKYDYRYRDTRQKERDFTTIAKALGGNWTAKTVKTRWESFRTSFTRLRKKMKEKTKSGAGKVRLTEGQKHQLDVLGFLSEHCMHGTDEEMGRSQSEGQVAQSDVTDEESASENFQSSPKPTATAKPRAKKSNSGSNSSTSAIQLIAQMYQDSKKAEQEISQKMDTMTSPRAMDERTAWGTFLASSCQSIDANQFRMFQQESWNVVRRYLPDIPLPPGTRLPPPSAFPSFQAPWQQQFQPRQLNDGHRMIYYQHGDINKMPRPPASVPATWTQPPSGPSASTCIQNESIPSTSSIIRNAWLTMDTTEAVTTPSSDKTGWPETSTTSNLTTGNTSNPLVPQAEQTSEGEST